MGIHCSNYSLHTQVASKSSAPTWSKKLVLTKSTIRLDQLKEQPFALGPVPTDTVPEHCHNIRNCDTVWWNDFDNIAALEWTPASRFWFWFLDTATVNAT